MDQRSLAILILMLLTGKVAAGIIALFHNSSLPQAFNYGKAITFPISHEALPQK